MKFNSTRLCLWAMAVCFCVMATGCTTVVLNAARLIKEDRSTDSQFSDTQIGAGILSALAEKDKSLLLDVNVDVWEARVLLTGTVEDSKTRQDVVRIVRADKRVKKIYDEIQVVSTNELTQRREVLKDKSKSVPEKSKPNNDPMGTDYWVETKISAQLVSTPNVTSVNYRWRSVRRTTYVIGRAQSKSEFKTVLGIVSATEGVEHVKSFVEIKPF